MALDKEEFTAWFEAHHLFPVERASSGQIVSCSRAFRDLKGATYDDQFDLLEEVFADRHPASTPPVGKLSEESQ